MWPNKYIKLSLFLHLTILATLTRGQDIAETTNDSLSTLNLANDGREDAVNLNIVNSMLEDQITVNQIDETSARKPINGEEKNTSDKSETNVDSITESATSTETQALEFGNNVQSKIDSATKSEINSDSVTVTEPDNEYNTQSNVGNATESETNSESVTETETDTNAESVTDSATESVTNQIDCVCDCTANGSQVKLECSTQTPLETQTENTKISENYASSNTNSNDELKTTNPADNEISETTTEYNIKENTNTASDTNEIPETTTQSNIETETSTLPPSCSIPGVQPYATVCQQYYDCSSEGSLDGSFHLLTKSCPDKQAFNIELNRCSRDLSSCSNPIECLVKGGIADPTSNSSYYLCEPRLIGEGFRIFHVDCSANELFYPELGKCFVDINNLPSPIYPPYYNWNQLEDIDLVKAEMKLLKEQDKFKLKQEKDRIKAEEKLQKQIEKEAKKRAKEQEKLNKEKAKQEAASFICLQEGNFKSSVAEDTYFACIIKKDKLKALVMQCPIGSKFNADSGTCVNNTLKNNGNDTDNDDDDNEDDD